MKAEEMDLWPPKYWKLRIETDDKPAVEVAYTDPRRFGRIRLVECPGEEIRKFSPLKENGPDPVIDTDVFTEDYLRQKMKSRHVPIKALLLDQTMISGIGNWVGDEVLFHAKLHPEQYSNDFGDEEIARLYKSIRYVCQLACDKLGDSDEFPEDWMFNFRWGKGKKHSHLPNGQKLAFLKVGGRTSCYAPGIQKNTGGVVEGIKEEPIESEDDTPKRKRPLAKSKPKAKKDEEADGTDGGPKKRKKPAPKPRVKEEQTDGTDEEPEEKKTASRNKANKIKAVQTDEKPPTKKRKAEKPVEKAITNGKIANVPKKAKTEENKSQSATSGGSSRRSSRLRSKAA
jgi:formamidopyrimidine-DNA glycosylase